MVKNLNAKNITSLKPGNYFDELTPGLCLRVGANRRTWYFTYKRDGQKHWLKVGRYHESEWTLAKAREQARVHRVALDNDRDPVTEKKLARVEAAESATAKLVAARTGLTFGEFVPEFIMRQQKKGNKGWRDDQNKIDRWLMEPWGDVPLKSITRGMVHDVLDTAEKAGLSIGVNRLQALISRVFSVALDRQKIDSHPAVKIEKRAPETPGDRVLTDAEIRAFWKFTTDAGTEAADVIKLRLLLGQRGGETRGMMRAELNLDEAFWELPRERTKTKQPHVVALPPLALAIVTSRAALHASAGIFLTAPTNDDYRVLGKLAEATKPAYVWKDLRRTVATRLAELGFTTEVIDRVLNHARAGVTGKHYNKHQYLPEIRQALDAWDRALSRILDGKPMMDRKVIPMRKPRR